MSRIMLAATGSGCGKTTIICGLCQCFKDMGLKTQALKCGPDYIDASFHSRVLGIQTGNLDSYFTDNAAIRRLVAVREQQSDITIIEGVMGYYDGQGFETKGSSYEIADITATPVILIINCRGMSNSIGALLKGYKEYVADSHIKGVIFNNMSERLYEQAKNIAENMGIKPLGYLPHKKLAELESRHLGLVGADETAGFKEKVDIIARQMKESIDIEGILKLSHKAPAIKTANKKNVSGNTTVRIAVAKDDAFCFVYNDNLDYLKERGCELVFFSPLADKKLPDSIDGLLLYGGYPELYAKRLSDNISMRKDIAARLGNGLPCIAECGGFLYLHEYLETPEGNIYPMAGVIKGKGYNAGGLQRFGYMMLTAAKDTLLAKKGMSFKAHEFHYWNSDCPGSDYKVVKASDKTQELAGYGTASLYAGFPHIYFYGNEAVADNFINGCKKYRDNANKAFKELFAELSKVQRLDKTAIAGARKHWNSIAKPLYGLGSLESIINQIAGIQQTPDVCIDKRAVIAMCADNGIVKEGVTQTGQEVTAVVSCNMADGISSVCRMAQCAGVDVIPVNIGIAADTITDINTGVKRRLDTYKGLINRCVMKGTKNFLKEPAMTHTQLIKAIQAGITQAEWCKKQGYRLLATGEMGIGNTTTSSALACILLDLEPVEVTGRGAGLDDKGLERKIEVVGQAKKLYGIYKEQPLELLSCIGGLDIAGLVGVYLGGAIYRLPVVMDGVISAVAALIAVRICPAVQDYIIASHQGREPAMRELLKELGKSAPIHAGLALGEGTGAVMLFPMLDMAMQVYKENTTFEDINITAYEDYRQC